MRPLTFLLVALGFSSPPRRPARRPRARSLAFIAGVGRRVEEPGLGLIGGYAFSAPYEDLKLRSK